MSSVPHCAFMMPLILSVGRPSRLFIYRIVQALARTIAKLLCVSLVSIFYLMTNSPQIAHVQCLLKRLSNARLNCYLRILSIVFSQLIKVTSRYFLVTVLCSNRRFLLNVVLYDQRWLLPPRLFQISVRQDAM